jgi:hypothetical protein
MENIKNIASPASSSLWLMPQMPMIKATGDAPLLNIMEEIWKDIPGYEGYYQVSNFGNVKSLDRLIREKGSIKIRSLKGRMLSPGANPKGYLHVVLSREGKLLICRIHKMVATLFIPNPLNLPELNHQDENKRNNRYDNLEWCAHLYNIQYGTGIKRKTITQTGVPNQLNQGEGCGTSKLKEAQVISIYQDSRKYKEIAETYNISFATISSIKHKTRWNKLLNNLK